MTQHELTYAACNTGHGALLTNSVDLAIFEQRFGSDDADVDLDGNGIVNSADLALFRNLFGRPPGPADVWSACDATYCACAR